MEAKKKNNTKVTGSGGVLLVEDNIADAKLFTKLLMENGYSGSLSWVSDGAQALDYLFHRGAFLEVVAPDLVILDLNLPKVDGREVLDQMSSHDLTRNIPVIVLSTSNRKQDIKICLEKGADSFFTKPSELLELRQLVQRLKTVEFPRLGVVKQ